MLGVDPAGFAGKMHEQRVLQPTQRDRRSADRDLVRGSVDPKLPILDHDRPLSEVAPHERLHPSAKLGIRERGAQHVIGSRLEPPQNVAQVAVRRHPQSP